MAQTTIYIIDNTDGSESFAIQPRTFDGSGGVQQNTDLTLYGNAAPNWGERFNENFYRLLENFSVEQRESGDPDYIPGETWPKSDETLGGGFGINKPVVGQIWFNKTDNKTYVYALTGSPPTGEWILSSGISVSSTSPSGPQVGDLWYDTSTPQLRVWSGTAWDSVADRYVLKAGDTMTGPLVIDGDTSGNFKGLEVKSSGGPYIQVSNSNTGASSAPAFILYNVDNDPTGSPPGVSGTWGWTKITNRDGDILRIERTDVDDGTGYTAGDDVLEIFQTGEMYFYGNGTGPYSGDIRIPNASITEPDHVTTKDYVDSVAGGTGDLVSLNLAGLTFSPSTVPGSFHNISVSSSAATGTPWTHEETISLSSLGIPDNATHVMIRSRLDMNGGNNGISLNARKNSSFTFYSKQRLDPTQLTGTVVGSTSEDTDTTSWIQEFDTTTESIEIQIEDPRSDSSFTSADDISVNFYLEGFYIEDKGIIDQKPTGFKNHIINGDMRFWQRGTSFSLPTSYEYTADRWHLGDATSFTASRSTDTPNGFGYSLLAQNTGSTTLVLRQAIELPRVGDPGPYYVGTEWTFSFWVKSDVSGPLAVRVDFRDNVVDAVNNVQLINEGLDPLTPGTWTRMDVQVPITFSPNGTNECLVVLIDLPNVASSTYITGLQFELGPLPTNFEHRPFQTELALCQRYFEKSYNVDVNPGTTTQQGVNHGNDYSVSSTYHCYFPFQTQKREVPSVTIYNPNNGSAGSMYQIHGLPGGSHAINSVGANEKCISTIQTVSPLSPADNSNLFQIHYTADAEL